MIINLLFIFINYREVIPVNKMSGFKRLMSHSWYMEKDKFYIEFKFAGKKYYFFSQYETYLYKWIYYILLAQKHFIEIEKI